MIGPVQVVAVQFEQEDTAKHILKELRALKREGMIRLIDVAVLEKDEDGNVSLKETADPDARQGALFGAVVGGLVGLIGGPVGGAAGAALGAATGGVTAARIDSGLNDEDLKALMDDVPPGSSAVVAIYEHIWMIKLARTMAAFDAEVLRQGLVSAEIAERIEAHLAADAGGENPGTMDNKTDELDQGENNE
ncbi:MAG: DUF1269 domain-containing protein [Anaerolineae bacterium]